MATSIFRRPAMRWLVPAGVTTAVVAAAAAGPLIAGADADLPERTALQLVTDLATAERVPFAGTVVQSADLGLPAIPGADAAPGRSGSTSAGSALISLLSGSTTARIWYADESTYRIALQDELAETDLIRDGSDVWFWNSEANTVSHVAVPADAPTPADLPHPVQSPSDLAELALDHIDPSTQVDVDGTATVAGRPAYELVVRPRDEGSLIGSVRLAVDGETSVPLRVQVYDLDGGEPAVEVGFTSVSFDTPDPSVFDFTPPAGATVEELDPAAATSDLPADRPVPTIVGEGWASVLVVRGVDLAAVSGELAAGQDEQTAALVQAMLDAFEPVSGAYGTGRAVTTGLVSALLLDDGRLLVGPVTLDVLEHAALDPAAAVDAPAATQ